MQILKLKINNFGKLLNKEIELKEGINIIYGKNESGKSTLLKFIMGMFYGLSKNKNGKFISDHERYTPWDGGDFSGKIEYKLDDDTKYMVFREFKKKNPVVYNENLQDISSTFNIDKTTGNKFFYDQTGVDEELFLSTIVSMQEEVKLDEKEQKILVQKISNLASTGEENLSFQKIINKLNKRQMEEIGTNRSQDRPINIVTKRLEQIQNEKEYLSDYANKQYEIGNKKEETQNEIKEDEKKLELLKALQDLQQSQELEREKIKINQNAKDSYKEKIQKLQNDKLKLSNEYKKDSEESSDNKTENSLTKTKKIKKEKIQIALVVIFILLTIYSILIIKNDIITAIAVVGLIVTSIYAGYTQYKNKLRITINKEAENVEKDELKNEINTLTNEIEILKESVKKQEIEIKQANEKLEQEYKLEIEKLRNKYIGIIPIKIIDEILQKETVIYDINMLQNKISTNKINLHTSEQDLNNILPQIENLAALEEESVELENEYNELIKKNDQINLAKSEIEKAYEIMKNNITPKFTNNLSEIIEKISGGKYKNVKLNEEKGIIIEVENGNYIDAKNLSIGTIDQLYLSLRLGAGLEISNEKLPVILDEAFAYWDDTRLENIIKFINEELKSRQIILFTCSNREKEVMEKLSVNYNYIEL